MPIPMAGSVYDDHRSAGVVGPALMPVDQVLLAINERPPVVIVGMADIGAIRAHMPGDRRIRHLQVDVLDEFIHLLWGADANQSLDASVEIAVHEIGGTDPHLGARQRTLANLRSGKMERTRMFSLRPGTPGLSEQMPRSTMSIFTPAWLAR